MNNEKILIPAAILITGLLIAGSLYLSKTSTPKQISIPVSQSASGMRKITAEDHIIGNPNAEVIFVEYSDTECPYCKVFHSTLQRMMTEYGKTGRVAWVYRHYPIDALHSKSRKEAEATECVNELGGPAKFWEYLNMIYTNTPSNNDLDPKELTDFAKAVGIDQTVFDKCLSSGKYSAKVEADYQDAIATGGEGTPHSIIVTKDGIKTPLDGSYSYDKLKLIIDAILK